MLEHQNHVDTAHSNRPERHSALIAQELSRLNVDIAAVNEVRFPGEDSLQEYSVGNTFLWSGKPTIKERLSGIGFMVSTSIASRLENLPAFL